jgi:hypothetical protein
LKNRQSKAVKAHKYWRLLGRAVMSQIMPRNVITKKIGICISVKREVHSTCLKQLQYTKEHLNLKKERIAIEIFI